MMMSEESMKKTARILLGIGLVCAGLSHLTFARTAFRAQVPKWVPLEEDKTVVYSGFAEILLGGGLIFMHQRCQALLGKIVALFFIAVLPGNIAQYLHRRDAFGLNTDDRRLVRLFFQPLLIYWAWKSTGEPSPSEEAVVRLVMARNDKTTAVKRL
jgi:uncharacterized membrane protein